MRVHPAAGAPGWALQFAEQVNRALASLASPQGPSAIYTVARAQDLPPASMHRDRVAAARDTGQIHRSNGAEWLGAGGGAWTAYTPTVTAIAGALGAASTSGAYALVGKTVSIRAQVQITSNGTAGGGLRLSLPVPPRAGVTQVLHGRENAVTGAMLQGVFGSAGVLFVFRYDNNHPGGDGHSLLLSGQYEAA